MLKLLINRSFRLTCLLSLLGLSVAAKAEEALFDPVAARMIRLSDEMAGEKTHKAPPVLHHLPDSTPTPSLARPTVTLPVEEQKHFGPLSVGRHYDPRMIQAARIARQRAEPHGTWYCWRYVKDALVEAGVVDSRPTSAYAKEAGQELCEKYGFVRLRIHDPMSAPVGAVLVYGGSDAGHVELRTETGFVSDFVSRTPYNRPLTGVYVKPS